MIVCDIDTCRMQYIGQSERKLKRRFGEYKGYVENKKFTQPTGYHFNLPGHSSSNMKMFVLEKVKKNCELYRKEREKFLIRKFNTFYKGMNKIP